MDKLFYLTSSHGNCGTNVMFWNKGGAGYGTNLNELELFTLEEAQEKVNQDIKSRPLLKSEVDKVAVKHVDCQYLSTNHHKADPYDEYVIQVPGCWDGNDIGFVTLGGITYDLDKAHVFNFVGAADYQRADDIIWPYSYMRKLARPTLQECNINTRKMITGPGIEYKKPRKPRPTTGKVRWNCPTCGKLNWQHNPYDFKECSDRICDQNFNW